MHRNVWRTEENTVCAAWAFLEFDIIAFDTISFVFFFSLAVSNQTKCQICSQIQSLKTALTDLQSLQHIKQEILMQAAIAGARQKPIKQCVWPTGAMRTCLLVYWANLIVIGALQSWYGSLPVCVSAANFVTVKWSAINDTSVPDRTVKTIHSPR